MQLSLRQKLTVQVEVREQFPETSTYEQLVGEICRLRFRVEQLEKENSDMNWQLYPDRMGQ